MNHSLTIFNSIKAATAASMKQSVFDSALYAGTVSRMYAGYNTESRKMFDGEVNGIVCGRSVCGSDERPVREYCVRR